MPYNSLREFMRALGQELTNRPFTSGNDFDEAYNRKTIEVATLVRHLSGDLASDLQRYLAELGLWNTHVSAKMNLQQKLELRIGSLPPTWQLPWHLSLSGRADRPILDPSVAIPRIKKMTLGLSYTMIAILELGV